MLQNSGQQRISICIVFVLTADVSVLFLFLAWSPAWKTIKIQPGRENKKPTLKHIKKQEKRGGGGMAGDSYCS